MTGKPTREQLHDVLWTLEPEARSRLVTELERGLLRGEEFPGYQIVMAELRRIFMRSDEPVPRVGNPSRLFFRTFEPFLVDAPEGAGQANCFTRASLTPLWTWICEKAAPVQAQAFCRSASEALLAGNADKAARLTRDFQDHVLKRMQEMLAAALAAKDVGRRVAREMATARGLADLRSAIEVLKARDALAALHALAEIEDVIDRIKADPNDPSLTRLLRNIPEAARGLRPNLDVPADSPWRAQLVAIRSQFSARLKREIGSLPERVRRLLTPRAGEKGAPNEKQVAEIERLIEFARVCGAAAQLHVQETIWNTLSELQKAVREARQALLAWRATGGAAGRDLQQARIAAAVRISAKVFDDDYAAQFAAEADVPAGRMPARRAEAVRTA